MSLSQKDCVPCREGAPTITDAEIAEYKPQIPDWDIIEAEGMQRLQRVFKFDDFKKAMEFSVAVGELAEADYHHPAILTEWGQVTITWWTHKIGGLHLNDFIMAGKTDKLA